jgi:hypothetical protein
LLRIKNVATSLPDLIVIKDSLGQSATSD